jgi:hypothetical protein
VLRYHDREECEKVIWICTILTFVFAVGDAVDSAKMTAKGSHFLYLAPCVFFALVAIGVWLYSRRLP